MSGRATVKGKGAEIFFGEEPIAGESTTHEDTESTTGPVEALTRAHPDVETPRRHDVIERTGAGPSERARER